MRVGCRERTFAVLFKHRTSALTLPSPASRKGGSEATRAAHEAAGRDGRAAQRDREPPATRSRERADRQDEPQSSRNAVVTGNRAARSAGYKPPMKPIASAHLRPVHSTGGATLNSNVSWPVVPAASVDAV